MAAFLRTLNSVCIHTYIENVLCKAFKMFDTQALKDGIYCQFLYQHHKTSQKCSKQFFCLCVKLITTYLPIRKCLSTGARDTQTHISLHLQILGLLLLLKPADFEVQSPLLQNKLHRQIQVPNAYPAKVLFKRPQCCEEFANEF